MEDDFNEEIKSAVRIRKERVLADHEISVARAKERLSRIEERLASRLENAERWAERDAKRLGLYMRYNAPPYRIKDWLILDSWKAPEAMLILAGLEPAPEELKQSRTRMINPDRGPRVISEFRVLRTLSGFPLWEDHSDIFPEWFKRVSGHLLNAEERYQTALRIWESGAHPERPTPMYVVEWAQKKGLEIPWLSWTIEVGLWPNKNESPAISSSEKATLQKQIAALALVLAEKSGRYKKGDKPNGSQIAEAVGSILEALPDANKNGLSASSIRTNIKAGLDLLTK